MPDIHNKWSLFLKRGAILAGAVALCGWAPEMTVSQKGRRFEPLEVDIVKSGTLVIVNDDGDLLHHAYIESETFSFDSGDQQPGSRTKITFPVAGEFKVLCGIHPKMKLLVRVH